jgi:DNA-binding LytR/AlgR family response regulator
MHKLRCLVVDDEELARVLVANYTSRTKTLELVGTCANPLEAIEVLREQVVDLLFLDIQMPELNGIDFLKSMPRKPLVVLTTAYSEYALEGYDLNVVDYLLKPFSFERFLQSVHKAQDRLPAPAPKKNFLLVKSEHKVHRLDLDELLYVQSMREYVAYYTIHGRLLSLGSLKQLEEELPSDRFVRIHKSYLVALDKARTLEGNFVKIQEVPLPIGANYKEELLNRFFNAGE